MDNNQTKQSALGEFFHSSGNIAKWVIIYFIALVVLIFIVIIIVVIGVFASVNKDKFEPTDNTLYGLHLPMTPKSWRFSKDAQRYWYNIP